LLPQALAAVGLAVLAGRGEMRAAVVAYALAMGSLLLYAALGGRGGDGAALMAMLNMLQLAVAGIVLVSLGAQARAGLPWRAMAASLLCLLALAGLASQWAVPNFGAGLLIASLGALFVMAATWWASPDLRVALAR
jgi:hypothetical protein